VSLLEVFLIALGTALATGLGAFPVLALGSMKSRSVALPSALAAGCMLGATIGLLYEGASSEPLRTLIGAILGVGFIAASRAVLGKGREAHIGNLRGARGMTALLVIGVMTVHSSAEGVALGVSGADEGSLGILIAVAIAIHNIPEGIAVSLTLIPHGETTRSAIGWSIFSSLPQPLMAVPAFLAVRSFEPLLPVGLGFAGGAMLWMVITQLLPEAFKPPSRGPALATLIGSATAMVVIEFAIGF